MEEVNFMITRLSMTCCCSFTKLCPILGNPMDCSTPGSSVLHYLPEFIKFMSIDSVMLSNHLILCCLFPLLPSIFPCNRVFSKELALCIRWPKYWSFNFSISSVQSLSRVQLFSTPWTAAHQASLSITNY